MIYSTSPRVFSRRLLASIEQEVQEINKPPAEENVSRSTGNSVDSEEDEGSGSGNSKEMGWLVLIEAKARLYIRTFKLMFGRKDCTSTIEQLALRGNLGDHPFRSLCWRVLLKVLPSASVNWVKVLQSQRSNYQFMKTKFYIEERMKDVTLDPLINNPLSQAEDSPWNQHFQDRELRRVIEQDVIRTFPDVEFFQNDLVRDSLINILFVYARCHPDIGYRQGMHELLAPLYFVLKTDCDKFSDITADLKDSQCDQIFAVCNELRNVIHDEILRLQFCEADAYSMFESLMEWMGPWFTSNKVVDSLNNIQNVLLRRHDPVLFTRLEKLEILPQIYGIRWLRLLFGREFVFRDTLLLWDFIFADSNPPGLCDQLVVSLLMAVRDPLLKYEYQDAVQLLMKLPSDLSVTYCAQFALHLKYPLQFPEPSGPALKKKVVKFGMEEKKEVIETGGKLTNISAPKLFSKMVNKIVPYNPKIARTSTARKSIRVTRNTATRKSTRITRNSATRKSKKVVRKEVFKGE